MNTDFRVAVDFFTHHKARKLKKRLGAAAVLSLLQLWAYAAKLRTDGNLSGMSVEDIELAAEWDGAEGAFSAALLDVGFLDQSEDGYSLHDWAENNPWVAEEKARSEQARKNAEARWRKSDKGKPQSGGNAPSKPEQSDGNAGAMQPQSGGNAPSPKPSPTPTCEEREGGDNARAHVATTVPENTPSTMRDGPKKTDCPSKGHPQRAGFMTCWQVYPVKQAEEEAWREWMRLFEAGTLAQAWEIRDAILTMVSQDSRWQKGKVPKFAKWLNGKCWNDEPYIEPAAVAQGVVAVRDGPPVARTQYQKGRQDMEGIAKFVLAADKELAKHGDDAANNNGIGPHGNALPAANEPGRASGHGNGMDGIVRQYQR